MEGLIFGMLRYFFSLSSVTVPEVFSNFNSAKFTSRFQSGKYCAGESTFCDRERTSKKPC